MSLWLISPAQAVDHNNLDAERPLDFDDAESIALGEKALEVGASIAKPGSGKTGIEASAEMLYGFAPNSHVSIDFDPRYASRSGSGRSLDFGNLGLTLFHNFNREFGNTPAFSLRADAFLPTGKGSSGVDLRLRAIASKQFRGYDRLHLNLDLGLNNSARSNQRRTLPGVILGYSHPLGYPTRFDRTLVAQAGYRANESRGGHGLLNLGVGLRQQVGVRSVMDFGLKGDLTGGANRKTVLTVGYSRQF